MFFIMLVSLVILPLYVGISNILNGVSCTEPITAKCLKVENLSTKPISHPNINARFEYFYEGKKYVHYSIEMLSKKEMLRFKEGQQYTVYVNPKKPKFIRCTDKKWDGYDLFLVLFGCLMFFATLSSLIMLFGNL